MSEEELIALDERIDDFLTKRLSEEEEKKFATELEADPALRKKVRENELIRDLVIEYNIGKLRERIKNVLSDYRHENSGRKAISKDRQKKKDGKKA